MIVLDLPALVIPPGSAPIMDPQAYISEFGPRVYWEVCRIIYLLGQANAAHIRNDPNRKQVSICMGRVVTDLAIQAGVDVKGKDGPAEEQMQERNT